MGLIADVGSIFTKALPWVTAGINLLSTVESYQGAKAVENQGRYNAELLRDEADAAWVSYTDKANVLREQQRLFVATQRTNYAKSGVTLEGTPMLVLNDIVAKHRLDQVAAYHTAQADYTHDIRAARLTEWQGYQQADAIRSGALSQFGASLVASKLRYPVPWTDKDTDEVQAAAVEAASAPRYTRAQANAVPGGAGWRPMRSGY